MKPELFDRELKYQTRLNIAKQLRGKGLLTSEEYKSIDTMLLEKYRPSLGGLLSVLDLN